MGRLAYLYDPIFEEHDPGPGHPESPARLRAIEEHLDRAGIFARIDRRACPAATPEQLRLVHTPAYVDFVLKRRGKGPVALDGGDTVIGPRSVEAALVAAGSATAAVDLVCGGGYDQAFCATRPPGHHARPDRAMGFCVFNNIALCAAYALQRSDISRVLIVDWDVHHGNGTQEIFYESDAVFLLSIHQSPFFPLTGTDGETGTGPGLGFTRNYPTLARKQDDYYVSLLTRALAEIESIFAPDLVLISAGFDAHAADPIGGMKVTTDGFVRMAGLVTGLAARQAKGRVISFLEGGYDHPSLVDCVERHLEALLRS